MAGTAFISPGKTWHVGSHAFFPIIERIRDGYARKFDDAPSQLFSSLDEGFEHISLEELSLVDFNQFTAISQRELDNLVGDETISPRDREFLSSAWEVLQNLLRKDCRFSKGVHTEGS